MRISPVTNNFRIKNYNKNTLNNNIKNNAQYASFKGVEYDPNYNKAMLELTEDSNRFAYHQADVEERKYILSKYQDSPSLYKKLLHSSNVRYYGTDRIFNDGPYCDNAPEARHTYNAMNHMVYQGDLTGTYLAFEFAPNQEIKDLLAFDVLNSYASYSKHNFALRPDLRLDFNDNPEVIVPAIKYMSDEAKNTHRYKNMIKSAFEGLEDHVITHTNCGTKNINECERAISIMYMLLDLMPANEARAEIDRMLYEKIRWKFNQYLDQLNQN